MTFERSKTAAVHGSNEANLPECGGKMRYEVRQQDGKWLVWDTVVDDCAMKSVAGAVDGLKSIIDSDSTPYMLHGGLLAPTPNPLAFAARPAMFWTQEEAQQFAETLNDIFQSGAV